MSILQRHGRLTMTSKLRTLLICCGLAVSVAPAFALENLAELTALYRWLHANPELSFHEKNTALRMAESLAAAGLEVTEGVGGHGVVAVLRNGTGPTLMLRGDMDGLPVLEQTGLPYASQARGTEQDGSDVPVMHACGHDVHMTVLVGAVQELVRRRSEWRGTLVAIAQPAEERGAGARAMLADGLFERFPRPDFNLSVHNIATLPAGQLGYIPGFMMANVDSVDITVYGVGGHGAYPQFTRDPVVLAASIVMSLQTLVSREVGAVQPAVVTVGSIHAGSKHNIIPDEARLQLTVRSYSDEVRQTLLRGIERIALHQARAFGLPEDRLPRVVVAEDEFTPALWNDPDLTRRVVAVFEREFGSDRVVEIPPEMGGEDFSRFGRTEPPIPGFMFRLGTVPADQFAAAQRGELTLPSLHSPFYAPDVEPTLVTGVTAMVSAALELFSAP